MGTKTYIYIGVFIGSIAGSWLGSLFDSGNLFGFWGFALGTIGAFAGVWLGYKLGNN